jgi:uncharacterized membrane protein
VFEFAGGESNLGFGSTATGDPLADGGISMMMDTANVAGEADPELDQYTHIMLAVTFLAVFAYDFLYKSSLAKNTRLVTIISFILIAAILYCMTHCAGWGYRAFNIHVGAMFGTIMAFNVWFRIWPAQQKIITAIKDGEAPDGDLLALAGLRSKHNTYLSLPLIWTMINAHTVGYASIEKATLNYEGGILLIIIAIGWHVIFLLHNSMLLFLYLHIQLYDH